MRPVIPQERVDAVNSKAVALVLYDLVDSGHATAAMTNHLFANGRIKPNVDVVDKGTGRTLGHAAAKTGDVDVADSLYENGVNFMQVDKEGKLPVIDAVANLNFAFCKWWFEKEKDTDWHKTVDAFGNNLTLQAFETGDLEMVNFVLAGTLADPLHVDNDGENGLHKISKRGDREMVRYGINIGIDPSAKNKEGQTPVVVAAKYGNLLAVQELLAADVGLARVKDTLGRSPLHWGSVGGNVQVIMELANANAEESVDANGNTPMHVAAYFGNLEIVQALVDEGGNIAAKNGAGMSALNIADKLHDGDAFDESCLIGLYKFSATRAGSHGRIANFLAEATRTRKRQEASTMTIVMRGLDKLSTEVMKNAKEFGEMKGIMLASLNTQTEMLQLQQRNSVIVMD